MSIVEQSDMVQLWRVLVIQVVLVITCQCILEQMRIGVLIAGCAAIRECLVKVLVRKSLLRCAMYQGSQLRSIEADSLTPSIPPIQ